MSQCLETKWHTSKQLINQRENQSLKIVVNCVQIFLVTEPVMNLPAVQAIQVPSLGWEDPLEKGTATHSSILAWEIP